MGYGADLVEPSGRQRLPRHPRRSTFVPRVGRRLRRRRPVREPRADTNRDGRRGARRRRADAVRPSPTADLRSIPRAASPPGLRRLGAAAPLRVSSWRAAPALVVLARRRPRGLVDRWPEPRSSPRGSAAPGTGVGEVFDRASPLFAPLWVGERATLAWVALARRLIGRGCPYAGTVIGRAANPTRVLRRRLRSPLSG